LKSAIIHGPNDVGIEDLPIPAIGSREILVRMKACGVCGTDIEKMHGVFVKPPVLGHEVTGDVAKIGDAVRGFRLRDRVFVHHHVPCYVCHYCRHGDLTMCETFGQTNLDPCGFSEYFRVPEPILEKKGVLQLPNELSYEEGTLIEPIACCIRGLVKCKIRQGDDVLVIGAGPSGLMHIQLLSIFGVGRVIVSEPIEFRLEAAKKFGADIAINPKSEDVVEAVKGATEGMGVDVVIVAAGNVKAIEQAIKAVRKGGVVNLFGLPPKGSLLSIDPSEILVREISIVPSYSTTEIETNVALKSMESRKLDFSRLITHRFRLESIMDAIVYAEKGKDALKIVVVP